MRANKRYRWVDQQNFMEQTHHYKLKLCSVIFFRQDNVFFCSDDSLRSHHHNEKLHRAVV